MLELGTPILAFASSSMRCAMRALEENFQHQLDQLINIVISYDLKLAIYSFIHVIVIIIIVIRELESVVNL